MPKIAHGIKWDDEMDDAQIERELIRHGGYMTLKGKTFGSGLVQHFKNYWSLLWPEDSQTWWTDLILENIIKNQFTSLVGPASAWKSGTVARLAMMDWSCFPDCTSVIMSSTNLEGLKSRIYGETTMMWKRAKERFSWFPGFPVDSKTVITNTNVEEETARDIRNSILGIACKTSQGVFIGMGAYSGRKNRRVWCIGDEFQFMQLSILQAQDNLISNDDGSGQFGGFYPEDHPDPNERGKPRRSYRCVFIGNTNPSVRDNPLDVVSEPEFGWGSVEEATEEHGKTQVWKCKQHAKHPVQCWCINLDGLDSPNSPYPIDRPRWSHLAGPHKIKKYTLGSESYWSNGRGRFKFGLDAFKIVTKELCDQFHAFDGVAWEGATTKIGALDAAYGSAEGAGDRCVLGWFQFGKCVDGKIRIKFEELWLVPIVIRKDMLPEDQIAMYCKDKMSTAGVMPEDFFFDGRGSLAMSLGRIWSTDVHSLEFGGVPTERPAGPDHYITPDSGERRLQTAKERYSKFVTELWMSWQYVIASNQMRGLTMDIVLDAQPREWSYVARNKIDIETKKDLKERTGISPDLADMVVTGIEGARRKGFVISKLGNPEKSRSRSDDWFEKEAERLQKFHQSRQLQTV